MSFLKKYFYFSILLLTSVSLAQVESQLYLEGARITDISQQGTSLWVATYGQGIYQYSMQDGKWSNFSSKSSSLENDLFHCVAANRDYIWAGANEGLYIYSKRTKKWTKRKFAQGGEFGNWIRSLKYDEKQNKLWIGRFRNITVLDVRTNRYTDYNRVINGDEKTNNFNTIKFDGDSVVWFGAESGVHRFELKKKLDDDKAWKYFANKGRLFGGESKSVSVSNIEFTKNEIWFGTDEFVTKDEPDFNIGGIYVWDRKLKWDRISKANGLGGNGIYCMEKIGNYMWVGDYEFKKNNKEEYGKGLYLINRITKKVKSIDLNELNLTNSNILSLFFDGNDLWIGSSDGLVRLKIANEIAHLPR